ncbi:CGNR zinc finger domain-containing protein [Streptomyces lasiicapitis]|uniref:CGNR zinc finger domain-containing protein n=1 Tax=Streptomyces lasiicapitis TaxID=1923961 RepID=UPI00333212B6
MPAPNGTQLTLTLALVSTIRHDGHGGVADDLDTPDGLTAWVRAHAAELPGALGARRYRADESALEAVRGVRAAVRALFARAVRPGEPSPADARRLLPLGEAVARLNEAAARVPTVPVLTWPRGGDPVVLDEPVVRDEPTARDKAVGRDDSVVRDEPVVRDQPAAPPPGHPRTTPHADLLTAALAHAALTFLASPDRQRLRACHAPRCVRYFLKDHPRQEWCRPACGNRARVARHHERGRETA